MSSPLVASPLPVDRITGLIIAGGLARRMGGVHKGLQSYQGRALLAHVVERFAPQVGALLLNVNHEPAAYAAFNLPLVTDLEPNYCGPLAGLLAGLAACQSEWLACVPCDAPHLPLDLVARLATALHPQQQARAALAVVAGRAQPLFLLCHRELYPGLAAYLARGERKFETWLDGIQALRVEFPDVADFANFNTLAELGAANAATHATTMAMAPSAARPIHS